MGLDLYAKVESLLGFEEARETLHALFLEKLKRLGAKKVLDIGCGSGRFMQIVQEEGMEVVGIDLSLAMVEAARQKGLNAYRMDLCDVTERFDAAVAIFDVLNYILPADLGHFLECAAMTLKCGGHLLCDINTPEGFEMADGTVCRDGGSMFVCVEGEFDGSRLTTTITLFEREGGLYRKEQERIMQYCHKVEAIRRLAPMKLVANEALCLFGQGVDKRLLVFESQK